MNMNKISYAIVYTDYFISGKENLWVNRYKTYSKNVYTLIQYSSKE
jgi:hypothetical protein